MHRQDRHVDRDALLDDERGVERPAGGGRAAGNEERGHQQDRGGHHEPEAPVVQARKGHVGRADLHRDEPVRESHPRRHDGAEHHHQAVHRGERVEELRVQELQARLEELGADEERHRAAHEEHDEREHQVERADVLVVGREEPALRAPSGGRARGRRGGSWAGTAALMSELRFLESVRWGYLRAALTSAGWIASPVLLPQELRV